MKYEKLNPPIADFLEQLAEQNNPPIYTLTPEQARSVLDTLQAPSVNKISALIEDMQIPGKITKNISLRIIRPEGATQSLPVIIYVHGAGWILGNKNTHDYISRSLVAKTKAAIVFVDYALSPESHYPVAIEQVYETLLYVAEHGTALNLDTSRIAIAGDSVGGCMATVVAQLAKERKGPKLLYQALLYPVTDAHFTTDSYREFADDYWLTLKAMEWFWNAYAPDKTSRNDYHVAPLQATIEQLKGLPPTLIITNEFDVLRDEAEAYARKLMHAGVEVSALRNLGAIHDIALLAPLITTPQAKLALDIAALKLSESFRK